MTLSRGEFVALLTALGAVALPEAASAAQPPWYPLPPPLPIGKGRALVLSGAGARGAYEAGVLKWLFRNVARDGLPFDVICGTSAGAINTAFSAQGTPAAIQETEQLWKGMPSANIIELEPPFQDLVDAGNAMKEASEHGYPARLKYFGRARRAIKDAGPPKEILKYMGVLKDDGIDALVRKYPLSLEALQTSTVVTATNVTTMSSDSFYKFIGPTATRRETRFLARTGAQRRMEAQNGAPPLMSGTPLHHALTADNFVDAVLASAAVPGVFQPVAVKRAETGDINLYVDGGVANNTPVSLAVAAGANDLTVIMADAADEVPKEPTTLPELLHASFSVMQRRILQSDTALAFAQNLLGRHRDWSGLNPTTQAFLDSLHQRDWTPVTLRLIRPRSALSLSTMGFNDQAGIDAAFDQGYADAQEPWVYKMG
jgi:predicted acylesterase/phospholipase RssA